MEAYRTQIVLGSVGAYMLLCVGVGLWALRRTRTSADFFVAGRRLGIVVTAVAIFSSTVSGFAFVGGPGLVYRMGTSSLWMAITGILGASLGMALVAKRVRLVAEARDTVSLPDVLAARYGSELTRSLAAAAILLGVLGYLATQILAMATVLKSLLGQTEAAGSTSLLVCALISAGVVVFYSAAGGMIASVYTDLVQGAVMVLASVLVFFTAWNGFEGGFAGMSAAIAADDPAAMGPWGTLGIMGCLSWFLLLCLGTCGQPHIVGKYMMFERVRDMKYILPLSVLAGSVAVALWFSVGMLMRASVVSGDLPALEYADAAAPVFLQLFANPALAALVFAALFAAIMSTADAFLSIGSAALVHDLPRAVLGRSLRREVLWARVATVGLMAVATLFALTSGQLVGLLGKASWGVFAGALVPALAIGLNWKGASAAAANASMLFALVANVAASVWKVRLPHAFDPAALILILSVVLFLVISLARRPRELPRDIDLIMDL